MIKANYGDKERIIKILAQSFDDNKSVNYIIPQDKKRKQRIRQLMAYSFDICLQYGKVFLSDDKKACVKRQTSDTILSDMTSLEMQAYCRNIYFSTPIFV
jgi:hypothetical protein